MVGTGSGNAFVAPPSTAEEFFEFGMVHASGRDGAIDLIAAHQWFNIAAARGHAEAAQRRREVATQMSDSEIGTAQRAARAWLAANQAVQRVDVAIRAAA